MPQERETRCGGPPSRAVGFAAVMTRAQLRWLIAGLVLAIVGNLVAAFSLGGAGNMTAVAVCAMAIVIVAVRLRELDE